MSHIQDIVNDIERPSNLLIGERSNFLLSLMALSAYIIRIDGDFGMQKQGYVQYFVGTYYEPAKAQRCYELLMRILGEQPKCNPLLWAAKIEECARSIASYTTSEQRLQIIDFLILVVRAGNGVTQLEMMALTNVAVWLGVGPVAGVKINQLRMSIF